MTTCEQDRRQLADSKQLSWVAVVKEGVDRDPVGLPGGDLFEGKRTLMLIHVLQRLRGDEAARAARFLGLSREQKPVPDAAWLRERMDEHGSLHFARQLAHGLVGAALYEQKCAFAGLPDSVDKRFLEAMPRWVLERN